MFATQLCRHIGCISTCLLGKLLPLGLIVANKTYGGNTQAGLLANGGEESAWSIGLKVRFPWLVGRPPVSFDFKHVFVVSSGLVGPFYGEG